MPDTSLDSLVGILERAEHVHGVVSESRDGVDPEWPIFYAWWLLEWSELPAALGAAPSRSELAFELMRLDREFRREGRAEPWSRFYAARMLEHAWGS